MRHSIRAMAFVLTLIMVLSALPFTVIASDTSVPAEQSVSEGSEGLQYATVSGGAYVIGYDGTDKVVTVPNTYGGKPVIGIDPEVFAFNNDITAVIIEAENISELVNGEFAGCESLEYIMIPDSVYDIIGITMWMGNIIPEVRYMGSEGMLLYDESEIGGIVYDYMPHVHNHVKETVAPTCTERGYTQYTCDVCGDSYTADVTPATGHIYDGDSDADCNVCGDVRVPEVIVAKGSCGESVFWKVLDNGTLVIYGDGSMEDYLVSVTGQPFRSKLSMIKKIVVEEGVLSIGRAAFYGFTSVTEVVLPDSLIAIHEYAFFGCTNLTTMNIPKNVFYIDMYALRTKGRVFKNLTFANTEGWTLGGQPLDVTDQTATIAALNINNEGTYKLLCQRNDVVDTGVTVAGGSFGNDKFRWTLSETGVLNITGSGDMPKFNVNTTPWYGYRGAIRSIVIGEGITSVGRCSFHTCRAVVSITLPKTLKTIVEYAFYNCPYVTSVTIPANVTRIEIFAFRKCHKLSDVDFAIAYGWYAGDVKISVNELSGKGAADSLTLAYYTKILTRDVNADVEVADPNYFANGMCNTTVKWMLTYNDTYRVNMTLTVSGSGDMPNYGTGAAPWYQYANSITEIKVIEDVTSIGRCAFYGLKRVNTVSIGSSVKVIGDYAFNTCSTLKEITIPYSVNKIGVQAFGKTALTSALFQSRAGWSTDNGVSFEIEDMANAATAATYLKTTYAARTFTRDESAVEIIPDNGWFGGKFYIDGEYVVSTEMYIGADYYSFDENGNATRITKDDDYTANY